MPETQQPEDSIVAYATPEETNAIKHIINLRTEAYEMLNYIRWRESEVWVSIYANHSLDEDLGYSLATDDGSIKVSPDVPPLSASGYHIPLELANATITHLSHCYHNARVSRERRSDLAADLISVSRRMAALMAQHVKTLTADDSLADELDTIQERLEEISTVLQETSGADLL